jgi:hypothetical protein
MASLIPRHSPFSPVSGVPRPEIPRPSYRRGRVRATTILGQLTRDKP